MTMRKNVKWFLAMGVAAVMTVSGISLAVHAAEKGERAEGQRPAVCEKGEFGKKGGPRGFHADHTKLLALLNIDEATFKSEIKSGKTLAAIASEHGVSATELKTFMVEQMTQRIDEGVKAGKIPADKAEKMKANMEQRADDMINGKGPMHDRKGPMHGKGFFDNTKLLEFLQIDKDTFKNERQAGKSLVVIAQEHGVSKQDLTDFMVKDMTQRIDEGVKAGRIPADKAEKMKENLPDRVEKRINHVGQRPNR